MAAWAPPEAETETWAPPEANEWTPPEAIEPNAPRGTTLAAGLPDTKISAVPSVTDALLHGDIKDAAKTALGKVEGYLTKTEPGAEGKNLYDTTIPAYHPEIQPGDENARLSNLIPGAPPVSLRQIKHGVGTLGDIVHGLVNPMNMALMVETGGIGTLRTIGGPLSRIIAGVFAEQAGEGAIKSEIKAASLPPGSAEREAAHFDAAGNIAMAIPAGAGAVHPTGLSAVLERVFKPSAEPAIAAPESPAVEPEAAPRVEPPEPISPALAEPSTVDTAGTEAVRATPPEVEPASEPQPGAKLLPGEKQGDLISSTQAEAFKLAGQEAIDGEKVTAEKAKAESDAIEAKRIEDEQQQRLDLGNDWTEATKFDEAAAQREYEASLSEDYQSYIENEAGATELLDALERGGGLPAQNNQHFDAFKGELSRLHETARDPQRKERISYSKIFRKDSPGSDALVKSLQERGFDVNSPSDVFDLVELRLANGKPVYGQAERGSALYAVPPGTGAISKAQAALGNALKTAATAVKSVAKFTDFRRSVLNWSARNQKATGEVFKASKDLLASVPDATRREGITNWIQANGDVAELQQRAAASTNLKLKKGYEAAMNLTPEEQALAGKVSQTYDILLKRAQAYGIQINEIPNYVNQIWRRQPIKEFFASSNRRLSTSIRFAKERYYDSFFHGEQAGLKPETKDIAKLLPIYMNEVNNAIAAKQFVADMAKGKASDGRPLLAPTGMVKTLEKGDETTHLVLPEMRTAETSDYKAINGHPALRDWRWRGQDTEGNPILVQGDLRIHPEAYDHLKNVLGESAIREWYRSANENPLGAIPKKLTKFLVDDVQQVGKATMLGFLSPFHQVQEATHAIGHRVNPFSDIPKINLGDAKQMDAAQHGLMLLPDRVSAAQFREGLDGSRRNILANLIGKAGKPGEIIKSWADSYQDYLFHQYIPGLKLKTYEHILPRNMERFSDELARGDVTESQIKYLSAQQANAAYGHLNYADIGRNPTMQHLMQTFLLAPDFLEARGRFVAQALKPSKAGREQLAALLTLAATQFVLSRALNKTLDDDYHWDQPFDVVVGNRKYGMRSVPADVAHAFSNTRQFVSGRLSPVIGRGLLEGLSGVNYRREPTTIGETVSNILTGMIPLTVQPATRGLSETGRDNPVSPLEQLLGSLGLHVSRFSPVSKIYSLAGEWTEKHGKDYGIDKREAVYPISKYQQLRYALEDGNTDAARKEYQRLLREERVTPKELSDRFKMALHHPFTGSKKTDEIFKRSLTGNDAKLFDAAVKRREVLWTRYQGIR